MEHSNRLQSIWFLVNYCGNLKIEIDNEVL